MLSPRELRTLIDNRSESHIHLYAYLPRYIVRQHSKTLELLGVPRTSTPLTNLPHFNLLLTITILYFCGEKKSVSHWKWIIKSRQLKWTILSYNVGRGKIVMNRIRDTADSISFLRLENFVNTWKVTATVWKTYNLIIFNKL